MADIGVTAATPEEVWDRLLSEFNHVVARGKLGLPEIFAYGDQWLRMQAPAGVPVQTIGLIGTGTLDFLARALACAVVLEDFFPRLLPTLPGAWVAQALDPNSRVRTARPDLLVLAPDWRDLVENLPPGAGQDRTGPVLERLMALFRKIWAAFPNSRIIQHLPAGPALLGRGVAGLKCPETHAGQITSLRAALLREGAGRIIFLDMQALANQIGTRRFAPDRLWHGSQTPFDPRFLPDYIGAFRGAFRGAFAKTKKILAVDLDNTLWGGIIGDDGLEGILLGPGRPDGEAFATWQSYLRNLAASGVVLAAVSKNDSENALEGLNHPASRLSRADFAAFECSWQDKVRGLRRVADALNIGLGDVVFADDNPVECALVREMLPEVSVVALGDDPECFIEILADGHWFDTQDFSPEDFTRGTAYAARQAAHIEAAPSTDLTSFLAGLGMKGELRQAAESDLGRIAQLEQKTNQFNLTTRRYDETAIRGFYADPGAVLRVLRLSDRFGDHGLIASIIATEDGDALILQSWVMSCRVFARTAEHFCLRGLIELARARGLRRILGQYVPSARNDVIAGLFRNLGFTQTPSGNFERLAETPVTDLVTHIENIL